MPHTPRARFVVGLIAAILSANGGVAADTPADALPRLRTLHKERRWKELVEQFRDLDPAAWPDADAGEAHRLRGEAYANTKQGRSADADFERAVARTPKDPVVWLSRGDNAVNNLADNEKALAAYHRALAITGTTNGWMALHATLATARVLTDQVKPAEALEVLAPYADRDAAGPVWRAKVLRAYGHAYAALGREAESLAKFREALRLEAGK